jgi:PAS domain-containing protein
VSPLEPAGAAFSSTVFDALPFPAFVADGDLRILATNPAARRLLRGGDLSEVRRRHGEVLHCINSSDGCGKSAACRDCVIRGLTTFAISGGEPARRRARLEYYDEGSVHQMYALVTA